MVIGFNSEVELSRSHTLMESGAWRDSGSKRLNNL
jgi:hypothetical protein